MNQYKEWIKTWLETHGDSGYGKCQQAVETMITAFPELRIARGHVNSTWGRRAHWWCVGPDSQVIDPTVSQFPGIWSYDEWKPGDEVRIGKCMNCGDEIWCPVHTLDTPPRQKCVCSEECERTLMADFNTL